MVRPACHAAIPSPECLRIHATMQALWSRQAARRFIAVFDVSAVAVESVLTHGASERRAIFLTSFVRDAGGYPDSRSSTNRLVPTLVPSWKYNRESLRGTGRG